MGFEGMQVGLLEFASVRELARRVSELATCASGAVPAIRIDVRVLSAESLPVSDVDDYFRAFGAAGLGQLAVWRGDVAARALLWLPGRSPGVLASALNGAATSPHVALSENQLSFLNQWGACVHRAFAAAVSDLGALEVDSRVGRPAATPLASALAGLRRGTRECDAESWVFGLRLRTSGRQVRGLYAAWPSIGGAKALRLAIEHPEAA